MVSSADRPSRKTAARLPAVVLRATRRPLPASRSALTYGRRMAIIHRATLRPSKLELVAGWVPGRPWGGAAAGTEVEQLGAYRFDDPVGEVGTETFVLRAGDTLLHVPLTYRGVPVPELAEYLVGTTEHSVLGRRWCYDACADPVYVAALAAAVLTGSPQAEEYVQVDGRQERRDPT